MPRNVALIVGSLRKESITRKIANGLVELAPPSLRFESIEIGNLPLYNQDLDKQPPAEWVELRDRVRPMDGVLFATPEYNRSIPAPLKNAIDIGSRPYGHSVWAQKPCAVLSVSPGIYGAFGANHHLRQCFVFLDMPCMQQPEAYIARADKALDDTGKIADDKVRDLLRQFVTAFDEWVERHPMAAKKRAA